MFEIQGSSFHFLLIAVCSLLFFCLEMSKITKGREVKELPTLQNMKIKVISLRDYGKVKETLKKLYNVLSATKLHTLKIIIFEDYELSQ